MMLKDNMAAAIERLKREVEYEKARTAAAEKREDELKAELEKKDNAIRQLEVRFTRLAAANGREESLTVALAKAATVFEGYACHHFLKGVDEKAQANRAHAKMCRDALATDEK